MRGLFGWHRSPENIRVIAYFAYLVPVVALYLRGDSDGSPAPTDKKDVAQVA
jgi:high-affinity Fe2+/Pb2+ permease